MFERIKSQILNLGNVDRVEELIKDRNIHTVDENGRSPLHVAVNAGKSIHTIGAF